MKRLLVPLMIAVLVCLAVTAGAAGDGVAFDTDVITMNVGETLQTALTREGEAAGGELTYSSSDKNVAAVDENGLVTALKKGRVTITAAVKAGTKTWKAQLKLTVVRPVTALTVKTDKLPVYSAADEQVAPYLSQRESAEENALPVLLLPVKKKLTITATAEPADASNRNTTFTSSDPAVFTAAKGAVTGVAPGEAILTIASESNPEVSTAYRVLVVQPVTKLTVQASAASVAVGGQISVAAVFAPENTTVKEVTWTSGDERILTVDESGVVTGIKRGNGRVIATAKDGSGIRANITVKVVQNPESITFNADVLTVDVGRNVLAKATVSPQNTDNKKVHWVSSDESVATVGKDGRINGISLGECTVTCMSDALSSVHATLTVHVQQPVKKLTFNSKSTLCYSGETRQLAWTIEPDNASNKALTFKSSNQKVATVDSDGVVTGVGSGKVTITAQTTDGSKRQANITVQIGHHVSGFSMVRRHAYLDVGETATAGADIYPKDALNTNTTWTSSDPGIVTCEGNSNHKMKLTGIAKGDAVVTGVTEDGGFTDTLPVTVGNFDKGVKFEDKVYYDKDAYFWLHIRNNTSVTITKIVAELTMYDASESDKPAIPINTKDGSNKVELVWTGKLKPGETTGKSGWKLMNFKLKSPHVSDTCGKVTLTYYVINNDWQKYIRTKNRPSKKFGYY